MDPPRVMGPPRKRSVPQIQNSRQWSANCPERLSRSGFVPKTSVSLCLLKRMEHTTFPWYRPRSSLVWFHPQRHTHIPHGYPELTLVRPFYRVFARLGVGWRASRPSNGIHAGDPSLQISRWVHDYNSRDHRWLAIWRERQSCWSQRGLPEQPTKHRSMGMFTFR